MNIPMISRITPSARRNRFLQALTPVVMFLLLASCRPIEENGPVELSVETVSVEAPVVTESFVPTLSGPLRALSLTPRGTLLQMPNRLVLTVTFSQPMVPLGEPPEVPADLFEIEPPVAGSARWEGSQTVIFEPSEPLVPATGYRVTVARSTSLTAISGDPLVEPISWTFETPRPRLVRTVPIEGSNDVAPEDTVKLFFNQPVRASELKEMAVLRMATNRRTVDTRFLTIDDSTFALKPVRSLSKETGYELHLDAGVPGVRGELGSAQAIDIKFSTYAPLRLESIGQEGYRTMRQRPFYPASGVRLYFSTPVKFEDLRQAISFEPKVDWPVGIEARDANIAKVHDIGILFAPETSYVLTIRDLEDVYGQKIDVTRRQFRTGPYRPIVYMPRGLLIIEADQTAAVPVNATNLQYATVSALRLSVDDVVPALPVYDHWRSYGYRSTVKVPEGGAPLSLARSKGGGATIPLRLDSLLTNGTGLVAVRLTARQAGNAEFRAIAQVTRLGVTAKFSPHANLVFVTQLNTGAPVAAATVTIRNSANEVLWTGTTGDDGRVHTPGWGPLGIESDTEWRRPIQFVFVEKDGDVVFTSSEHDDGVEPYRFGVWYHWRPPVVNHAGSVFSDRGLYRVGETVHIKGILRQMTDADWKPVTDSVRVVVLSSRDEAVIDRPYRPSALGTFNFDYVVPASADQGFYRVVVARRDSTPANELVWSDRTRIAFGSFRVDAFRTATFSVDTRTSADSYVAGDFFEGSIEGRYLFGAAMRVQPVRYFLSRSRGWYRPPGFDAYQFSQAYDWRRGDAGVSGLLVRADTVLGNDGTIDVRTALPGNDLGVAAQLNFDATVTDPARQEMSSRSTLTLHPGLFYIGIKTQTTFLDLQKERAIAVDFITVDPNGAFVGPQDLKVQLIRRQWISAYEVGSDGRLRWRSEVNDDVLAEETIQTKPGSAQRVRFPVEAGGSYLIRAEGQDLRGNAVGTTAYFYATGRGYVAWQRGDDDRIELVADRDEYRPGETAKIMVQSPFEKVTALISVEREGIISSRVETLEGSAPQIEIPLGKEHMPNVFVSVILLHGRTAPPTTHQDTGAPAFKIGYVNLRVDPGERHLSVEVQPDAKQYRPGDEVTVDLRLRDARGNGVQGEIAFSAADAGVLNLIAYKLPDPFDAFYGPRRLHVSTSEARTNLVRQRNYGQKEEERGGGGGDADYLLRKDFRPSAHWAPAVQTDGRGRATVTFRLPESLTTFRLMAAALSQNNEFGAGSTDIVVTQPLVMQPALPRFARIGDALEAGVLVTNTTGAAGDAVVTAQTDGLQLEGAASKSVLLEDGDTKEVRFRWNVPDFGANTVTFSATLAAERDALQTSIPVMLPTTRSVSATFASTESSAKELLRPPANRMANLDRFSVNVSSTALAGLEGAVDYLFRYPYGCLEQRTSMIRPLLLAEELIETFDLKTVGGKRDQLIQEWFDEIDDYWTGQGYTMWRGGRTPQVYLSAYVLLALAEAADAGYAMPEPVTTESVRWLEERVRAKSNRPPFYNVDAWTTSRAFSLYVLARHRRFLRTEIDELATALPVTQSFANAEAAAHLLRAVELSKEPALQRHRAPLLDLLQRQIRVEQTLAYLDVPADPEYGWIYPSTSRATAHGVIALVESGDDEERLQLAQRMVRYLIRTRTSGWWPSTQDNAVVVDALKTFYERFEEAEPDLTARVRLAGEQILSEAFRGRSLGAVSRDVGLDKFAALETVPVDIEVSGTGRLYYDLTLESYSTEAQQALSTGLQVARRIQRIDVDGQPVGTAFATGGRDLTLQAGEMVMVTVTLTSPSDRNYVVVDDALPAGLEALNTTFVTADRVATQTAGSDRWWGSFNHTEIRDDRVLLFADYLTRGEHRYSYVARATTPGNFVHPPAQAELMYNPEVRARNATGRLVVASPSDDTAAR